MKLVHEEVSLGEITSRSDAESIRESMRGAEFSYGMVSNALDFALSGDDQCLVYLSPRDRRKAEELARAIREAIG